MEANFLLWLQSMRTPWFTPIMQFITNLGNSGFIAIIICLILLARKKTRCLGVLSSSSLFLNFLITNVIAKNVFARIRPYEVIEGLTLITRLPHDYSFPSGHTSSSFAVAGILFLYCKKKIGIPAVILACLIAFSRLYVGVHYPTDVLAGAVIGIVCSYIVYYMDKRMGKNGNKKFTTFT